MSVPQCISAAGTQGVENAFRVNANFIAILNKSMDFVVTENVGGVQLVLVLDCVDKMPVLFSHARPAHLRNVELSPC